VAESAFRIIASGFYGAIAQRLTRVRQRWKALVILVIVLPVTEQTIDYLIHRLRGTPNLGWAMLTSCVLMAVSACFNWYAMTHGVLQTGTGAKPLKSDLKQLPLITFRFVLTAPLLVRRVLTSARPESRP
jgi:hypothetical protein